MPKRKSCVTTILCGEVVGVKASVSTTMAPAKISLASFLSCSVPEFKKVLLDAFCLSHPVHESK